MGLIPGVKKGGPLLTSIASLPESGRYLVLVIDSDGNMVPIDELPTNQPASAGVWLNSGVFTYYAGASGIGEMVIGSTFIVG